MFFNDAITSSKFPSFLKMSYVKAVSNKGTKSLKPISILTLVSKILEKVFLSKQLTASFDNILSKHQCGVRKGHDTQHCLLLMLGIWKKALDNKVAFWSIIN